MMVDAKNSARGRYWVCWLLVLGCGGAQERESQRVAKGDVLDTDCPMHVEGTTATYQEVPGGAALAFETERGELRDLRQLVARAAGAQDTSPLRLAEKPVPHATRADVIDRGSRLIFTPLEPGELATLRAQVRARVVQLGPHSCNQRVDAGAAPEEAAPKPSSDSGAAPPPSVPPAPPKTNGELPNDAGEPQDAAPPDAGADAATDAGSS